MAVGLSGLRALPIMDVLFGSRGLALIDRDVPGYF
jgi:hypothetical protein